MASKLTKIAQQHSEQDFKILSRQSIKWLQTKVQEVKRPYLEARQIAAERDRRKTIPIKGKLYFYYYDPKTKDELPYYDIFPMTLILERYNDGFLGLNLHYLPVLYRAAFLDLLLDKASYDEDENIDRIRISYQILNSMKKYKAFEPCLKRYLYSHMKSPLLKVDNSEWETALFLPVEQFRKARKATVHRDSVKTITNKKF